MQPTKKNAFDVLLLGAKRKRPHDDSVIDIDDDEHRSDTRVVKQTIGDINSVRQSNPAAAVAPLFRSLVTGRKHILCVRHGHTQGYHIPDTPLSLSGQQAASTLSFSVPDLAGVEAAVCSPLSRALHTMVLGVHGRGVGGTQGAGEAGGIILQLRCATSPCAVASGSSGSAPGPSTRPLPLHITPLAAEKTATVGDVGTRKEVLLQHAYLGPVHAAIQAQVPDGAWWRWVGPGPGHASSSPNPKHASNDGEGNRAGTRAGATMQVTGVGSASASAGAGVTSSVPSSFRFPSGDGPEALHHFRARVARLRDYLRALPYSRILLVAHAETIKELTQSSHRLDYCQAVAYTLLA